MSVTGKKGRDEMTITERVAYIKGLMEGLSLAEDAKETKVLKAMLEALEDMALSISDLEDDTAALGEEVDALSEDLEDLENDYYDEDSDEEDDEDYYELTCSECGDTICVDEDTLFAGDLVCPNCGAKFPDFTECTCGDCDDGCDCGCDHDHSDGENDED